MGFINLAEKTIHAKLVYYGVGMGGKTTSLQQVHTVLCPSNEVKLVSINTDEDATLLFDFLPINLGLVEGFQIMIQGFTVPGQPKYKLMRKYVLQGADAVVLVVDTQTSRLEENTQALEGLQNNLRQNGLDPETIPIVMQYNKRDLDDILTEEELDRHFLYRDGVQAFPSVAVENQGVFETFVHAAGLLVEAKINLYGLGKGDVDAKTVAAAARKRLWQIFDEMRGERESAGEILQLDIPEIPEDPASAERSCEPDKKRVRRKTQRKAGKKIGKKTTKKGQRKIGKKTGRKQRDGENGDRLDLSDANLDLAPGDDPAKISGVSSHRVVDLDGVPHADAGVTEEDFTEEEFTDDLDFDDLDDDFADADEEAAKTRADGFGAEIFSDEASGWRSARCSRTAADW